MTPAEVEEYRALRDTIRERGTARVWIFVAGLAAWAALILATATLTPVPISELLPLLVLAATFEAVFSLHIGVERIGRYVQVFLEPPSGWEHQAMAFGRPARGTRLDPLFTIYFVLAVCVNFIPVLVAEPIRAEWLVVGGAHLIVIARILVAKAAAGRQRAVELERFTALKRS